MSVCRYGHMSPGACRSQNKICLVTGGRELPDRIDGNQIHASPCEILGGSPFLIAVLPIVLIRASLEFPAPPFLFNLCPESF